MALQWETNRALQARMAFALVLVVVLPVTFVYAFVLLMNTVGVELLTFATEREWRGRFYVEPWLAVGAVAVGFVAQYLLCERSALRAVGARRVDPDEYPEVHDALVRLSGIVGVETPDLAVARTDVPNAFAVGRRPSHATVVVTTGLLDLLDAEEIDSVLAHELAHIRNRDVSVMTLAYFLPSLAYLVAIGAYLVLVGVFKVLSGFRHVDDDGAKGLVVVVVVLVVSAVCTMLVSAAFWVGSFLLFRLLSQYREFAADRGAVAIIGDPSALASALRKLDDGMSGLPDTDLRDADGGIEALYVAPIDDYQFGEDRELISSDLFPATHPPVGERIERLRDLAREAEIR
ncbi:M48 family metalloprotease [Salinirubellus sp. GCM10025818]|uniref:M48 family metalloprotease n=1 Tax=Salinirubellus TaxID=2162630 RepID=UPI0030D51F9A